MPSKILVEQIAHTNETSALDIDSSGNMVLQKDLKFNATAAIKNSAGNAILQESGGNVTLSNASLTLPASGAGITDSSGNAVLSESGGTVTLNKGTLGSAVDISTSLSSSTFPAGHIIQTVNNIYGGGTASGIHDSDSNSDTATYYPFHINISGTNTYYWSTAIHNVKANSHVIVMMKFNYYAFIDDYNDANYGFCIYRGTTNPVTSNSNAGSVLDYGDGRGDWIELRNMGGNNYLRFEDQHVMYYYDSSPNTGTNVYTPGGAVGGANGGSIRIRTAQYQQSFQCVLQEVAQ